MDGGRRAAVLANDVAFVRVTLSAGRAPEPALSSGTVITVLPAPR